MKDSGIYLLIIKLNRGQNIRIGKLGKFNFKKGFYVYTGSALNGLKARIRRHKNKKKKKFWHIDYLLASKNAKISKIIEIKTEKRLECKINKIISSLVGAKIIVKNFGSSDCNCRSHLHYFADKDIKIIYKLLTKSRGRLIR